MVIEDYEKIRGKGDHSKAFTIDTMLVEIEEGSLPRASTTMESRKAAKRGRHVSSWRGVASALCWADSKNRPAFRTFRQWIRRQLPG